MGIHVCIYVATFAVECLCCVGKVRGNYWMGETKTICGVASTSVIRTTKDDPV